MNSELHPLEPFLPANARILMLGSFPPKRIRWSMDFFYPNLQNDMWRIVGYLAAGDKSHFLMPGGRKFDKERIEAFCRERGIALYDTAVEVTGAFYVAEIHCRRRILPVGSVRESPGIR